MGEGWGGEGVRGSITEIRKGEGEGGSVKKNIEELLWLGVLSKSMTFDTTYSVFSTTSRQELNF